MHTVDAAKTIERIVGLFPLAEQHIIRLRFSKAFRYIISQRLMPSKDGSTRLAAIEILKSTMRTRDYVEKGESEGKSLVDAMRDGDQEGMQDFDTVIERYIRAGIVDLETGLAYATNSGNLRLSLSDFTEAAAAAAAKKSATPAARPAATALTSTPAANAGRPGTPSAAALATVAAATRPTGITAPSAGAASRPASAAPGAPSATQHASADTDPGIVRF
jgi:twitching motility protein PilT